MNQRHTPRQQEAPDLMDAIQEHLSPAAVALIASKLQLDYARGPGAEKAEAECRWLTEQLVKLLGPIEYEQHCKELGL